MTTTRIRISLSVLAAMAVAPAWSQDRTVYRCPGNPVLYTSELSAKEARDKGCRTLEGAPITVIQGPKARPNSGAVPVAANREKVDTNEQRARDSDARRILESELRKEEDQLNTMRRDFNNGEPERRGDERNFQKYQDRVAEMKAAIARKESDIAALRRELGKTQPGADNSTPSTPRPQ